MIKLKESCLFKSLALFCGCLWWPPCETPPRRLSGKGWAPSFLLHRVEAYPNSLFPSKKCSSLNPLSFNFDSSGLFISSLWVKMFRVKKSILSHFPWPICICTRHFTMEFHIIKAWCLQGKFQFSIMGQFNIKCHFLPQILASGRRALSSIRFLYLSSHDTALGGVHTPHEKQSQQLGPESVVTTGHEIMDSHLLQWLGVEGGNMWGRVWRDSAASLATRTSDFTLSELRSHWDILSWRVMWSELCFRRPTLTSVLKIHCGGGGWGWKTV